MQRYFGFFQSDGKSFQVLFLSCGPLSTHLARLSEVLQYGRAGPGRVGRRMDPILLSPLTRGKKKKASATSLSGFCAPFVLRHRSRTQKNGPGGKLDTARPHVSHRHLEARSPRDWRWWWKKKRIHREEISWRAGFLFL